METAYFDDPVTRAAIARQMRFERWTRLIVSAGFLLFFAYHCSTTRLADKMITPQLVGIFLLFAVIYGIVWMVVLWLLNAYFFAPTRYGSYAQCAGRMQRWAKGTIPGLRFRVWKQPWPQLLGIESYNWTLIVDGPATGFRGMVLTGAQILDVTLSDKDPVQAGRQGGWRTRLLQRLLPMYAAGSGKRRWWLEVVFTLPDGREPAHAVYPFGKHWKDAENWRQCILSLKI